MAENAQSQNFTENNVTKKKPVFLIIALLLVLVVAGGFGTIKFLESKGEEKVAEILKKLAAPNEVNIASIDYDLLGGTLIITDIKGMVTYLDESLNYTIATTTIEKPNLKALEAKSGELPLVAQNIVFENISTSGVPASMRMGVDEGFMSNSSINFNIEKFVLENWHQNLPALAQVTSLGLESKEFWAEAFNFTIGTYGWLNYSSDIIMNEIPFMKVDIASGGIIQHPENKYSYFMNDTTFKVLSEDSMYDLMFSKPENIKELLNTVTYNDCTLARAEIKEFALYSPEEFAELMTLANTMEADPLSDEYGRAASSFLVKVYSKMSPYKSIDFSNMVFYQGSGESRVPTIKIGFISNILNTVNPEFGLDVKNIEITQAGFEMIEEIDPYLFDPFNASTFITDLKLPAFDWSFNINLKADNENKNVTINTSSSFPHMFDDSYNVKFNFPIPVQDISLAQAEENLVKTQIESLNYTLKDLGGTARLINFMQMYTEEDLSYLLESLSTLIAEFSATFPGFDNLFLAFEDMIYTPGTLNLSLEKPISLNEIFTYILFSPEKIGLKVDYTGNGKSIELAIEELN